MFFTKKNKNSKRTRFRSFSFSPRLKKRLFVGDFDVSSLSLWRSALTSASHVTRCRSNGCFQSLRLLQRAVTPTTSFVQTFIFFFLIFYNFLLLFPFSVVDTPLKAFKMRKFYYVRRRPFKSQRKRLVYFLI